MSGYSGIIAHAINVRNQKILDEVEEIMRQDIFHSTLDWQTLHQLEEAAKLAYAVWRSANE